METCWSEKPQDRPFFPDVVSKLQLLAGGSRLNAEIADINDRVKANDSSLLIGEPVKCEVYPAVRTNSPFETTTSSLPAVQPPEEIQMNKLTTANGYLKLIGTSQHDDGELYDEPHANVPQQSPRFTFSETKASNDDLETGYVNARMGPANDYVNTHMGPADDYVNTHMGPAKRHSLGALPSSQADYEEFYYNMPKSYLEVTQAEPKRVKSTEQLQRSQSAESKARRFVQSSRKGEPGSPRGKELWTLPSHTAKKPMMPPGKTAANHQSSLL